MKKSIIALLMLAPMAAMAQNTWEVPSAQQTEQVQKKALFEKKKKTIDKKYLAGAVPVVGGKVTFTLDKNTALALDRTVFSYTIIAKATEGHLNLTLSRISYQYEMDRTDTEGMNVTAEEWITDEEALNKKKTGLNRMSAKFRIKTIDRKDNIFDTISNALR